MNNYSRLTQLIDYTGAKFRENDRIRRTDYPNETFRVIGFIEEEHPFYTQIWYVLENRCGEQCSGLQSVIEESCELNN